MEMYWFNIIPISIRSNKIIADPPICSDLTSSCHSYIARIDFYISTFTVSFKAEYMATGMSTNGGVASITQRHRKYFNAISYQGLIVWLACKLMYHSIPLQLEQHYSLFLKDW